MRKVSVIIAVYNTKHYLKKCLDSVINQTYKDIEIVIVNDGSTDGSIRILQDYADSDSRIKLINTENNGRGSAKNTGIREATGDYITFVDSDDYIDLGLIESFVNSASRNGSDIVTAPIQLVTTGCRYIRTISNTDNGRDILSRALNIDFHTGPCAKLYSHDLVNVSNAEFDESIEFGEDLIFYLKVFTRCQALSELNDVYYCYRNNYSSSAGDYNTQLGYRLNSMGSVSAYLKSEKLYEKYKNEFSVFYFRCTILSTFWLIGMEGRYARKINQYMLLYKNADHRLLDNEYILKTKFSDHYKKYRRLKRLFFMFT